MNKYNIWNSQIKITNLSVLSFPGCLEVKTGYRQPWKQEITKQKVQKRPPQVTIVKTRKEDIFSLIRPVFQSLGCLAWGQYTVKWTSGGKMAQALNGNCTIQGNLSLSVLLWSRRSGNQDAWIHWAGEIGSHTPAHTVPNKNSLDFGFNPTTSIHSLKQRRYFNGWLIQGLFLQPAPWQCKIIKQYLIRFWHFKF